MRVWMALVSPCTYFLVAEPLAASVAASARTTAGATAQCCALIAKSSFLSAAPGAARRRSLVASPEEHGPVLPLDLDLEAVVAGLPLARGEAQNVFVTQVL